MKLNRVTHANEWWWLMIKRRLDSHERWILKICQKSIRQLTRNHTREWHKCKHESNVTHIEVFWCVKVITTTRTWYRYINSSYYPHGNILKWLSKHFFYLKCFLFLDIFFFSCELNIWRYFHSMKKFVFDGAEICAYTYVKKGKVNV